MRSSRVVTIAVILVAILIVSAVAWLAVTVVNNRSEYTKHGPISIVGNGGFTHANGVVGGTGTASDPYIIADWEITAHLASAFVGISITDTDAHFIIRNCYVHGGSTSWIGIYLSDCANGILENNNCSDDLNGITLDTSNNNNTLIKNTCSSNSHDGITIGSGSNNALINNTCSSNDDDGIYLVYGSNNTLRNNICSSDGHHGISIDRSNNNALINNNCSSNDYDGIYLYSSSNNALDDNNCSSNHNDGISLSYLSNSNEIAWNEVSNNGGCGVNISSGSNNRIFDNAFIGNNGATGTYNASHAQARDDGTHNLWNYTYVYSWDEPGNYWSDWTTPDVVSPQNIVDYPYIIAGSAGAKDYYPLPYNPRYIGIAFVASCIS